MALAAIDDLDDALDATRQFLFPVDAGRWLRLAVVAFFVGGAGGLGSTPGGDGGGGAVPPAPDTVSLPGLDTPTALVAALLALALLVAVVLVYAVIGAIMEFILVEALRRETVHLRSFTRRHWRAGVRLFAFRLGIGLLTIATVLVLAGGLLVALGFLGPGDPGPLRLLVGLAVGLPLLLVVVAAAALVLGLTTDFVVPVMLLERTTVLGGWRRFWPTLRHAWSEYLVYVLVAFVLRLVAGSAVAITVGVVAAVLLLPLGVVGAGVALVSVGHLGLWGWLALAPLVAMAAVVLLAVTAVVQVPVVTYFRYYALLVLGDTEDAFDLIPERRDALRTVGED